MRHCMGAVVLFSVRHGQRMRSMRLINSFLMAIRKQNEIQSIGISIWAINSVVSQLQLRFQAGHNSFSIFLRLLPPTNRRTDTDETSEDRNA